MYNFKRAFTLIELSIVLVIIGLIVGGVLVGKDLIRAAELRKVITDTDKFITAYYAFKNKYNCIPGDCANATQFFSGTVNGNDDGIIQWQAGGGGGEGVNVWNHLGNAGLIEGTYPSTGNLAGPIITEANFVKGPMSGTFYAIKHTLPSVAGLSAFSWDTGYMAIATRPINQNYIVLGKLDAAYGGYPFGFSQPSLTSIAAKSIDIKMDDGLPQTGKVDAVWFGNDCFTDYFSTTIDYANTNPNVASCVFIRRFE